LRTGKRTRDRVGSAVPADRARHAPDRHAAVALERAAALRRRGEVPAAIAELRRALRAKPDDPDLLTHLGSALREQGNLAEAAACHRRVITRHPTLPAAHNNLGNVLRDQGLPDQALACYRRAVALAENFTEAHANMGAVLHKSGALDAAILCYRHAIRCKPDYAEAHANLGVALRDQGDTAAALGCYRRAIELKPALAVAYSYLGVLLLEQGAVDEAAAAFEAAIARAPLRGAYHRMLVNTGRVVPSSAAFARLEALAARSAELPPADRLEVHFALATLYAECGQAQKAAPHLLAANRLKRQRVAYDEAKTLGLFERIKQSFPHDPPPPAGPESPHTPIFIVGMPRSGTTLLEQILASHPAVHGAGELPDLPRLAGPTDTDRCASLAASYLAAQRRLAPAAAAIVDKLPDNFLRIGVIRMAIPGAKIIHVLRDPIDTCLSCFSKLFSDDHPYSYDLAELGRYYLAYQDLMAHWRRILPPGAMLDIAYEDIVADLEGQARRLLAFCGIPFHESCLAFHGTRRVVRTASAAQVRRPLYADSIHRWHAFPDLAGMLFQTAATPRP